MRIDFPDWASPLFKPYRYKVLYGGRGSAKSYTIAKTLLTKGLSEPRRILCGREFQNSISESVIQLLAEQIEEHTFYHNYIVLRDRIVGKNGTEFLFKGMRHNIDSIKSMQGITDVWLEEAQNISQLTWDKLVPTIRTAGSEIYVSYNPENEDDPTHQMFVMNEPPPGSFVRKVNHYDNPWFPDVLREKMSHDYATNPDLAVHIWEGECRSHSDAQIFKGKFKVDEFIPQDHWYGPYYGVDWGFSVDPTAVVEMYIDMETLTLYIRREAYDVGVELDDLPELFDRKVPGMRRNKSRADNSRPETISHIRRKGFDIEAAEKWSGSVEDGIEFIKSFKQVIIHSSCPNTAKEFKNYSYKVDRLTQEVTTIVVDAWNHSIDAIRYGLQPMIKGAGSILDVL
jgi:phage terminase large subunit